MKRAWSWVSFLVGAAGAAVLIGGLWLGTSVAEQKQQTYEQCLADLGYYPDDPNVDIDGLLEAADQCD